MQVQVLARYKYIILKNPTSASIDFSDINCYKAYLHRYINIADTYLRQMFHFFQECYHLARLYLEIPHCSHYTEVGSAWSALIYHDPDQALLPQNCWLQNHVWNVGDVVEDGALFCSKLDIEKKKHFCKYFSLVSLYIVAVLLYFSNHT